MFINSLINMFISMIYVVESLLDPGSTEQTSHLIYFSFFTAFVEDTETQSGCSMRVNRSSVYSLKEAHLTL